MIKGGLGHALFVMDCSVVDPKGVNDVLLAPVRGMDFEERSVRLALFEPGKAHALASNGSLERSKPEVGALEVVAEPSFGLG